MSKKTILSVELLCPKCRQKVMHVISELVGITSITLDPSKNTVMVTGEADPFKIIKKVRKFRKHASINSSFKMTSARGTSYLSSSSG
ncbi:hypothetical protein GOBAR_DD21220 [Gossypium barbadense]|nr:hypothetical protein GOBAR_DD21220 [Gossypium barbadense]